MKKINPKLSQDFLNEIKTQTPRLISFGDISIKTCTDVFPPKSDLSESSERLNKIFGDIRGKSVLDIGTGTGIQAIQAIKHGAKSVVAIDISDKAVDCAINNVKLNHLEGLITVVKSDLFNNLPPQKFEIIIANIPITDYPITGVVESALYDPDYVLHRRLFKETHDYLSSNGVMILSHANFKGDGDFEEIESMMHGYQWSVDSFIDESALGYVWRKYRLVSCR